MRLVVIAGAIATFISFLGTPLLINLLRRHGYAQAIRASQEGELYPAHEGKRGTPSMGGLAIIIAVLAGYFLTHLVTWRPVSISALLVLYLMVGLGLVGMADDYLKIFKQRSTGLRARTKLIGQAVIAFSFAYLSVQFPDDSGNTAASMAISFVRDTSFVLPLGLFLLWVWFLVTATTNGVNLTDGLDGLAVGAAIMSFLAYVLLAIWQYGQNCAFEVTEFCYNTQSPLDLAMVAAATAGASFGFLWFNTSPARIFMGDTGSLALGGGIAGLAILTRTELLLPLLAGLFLITTLSVIGQVGSFKLTGKRIFRMAPLHHHFEMLGWPEIQIVVRFWIIQGLCIGAGLTIFYAEWVRA
ncbi:MAG: phospho-N-acetylmuramoyl-pentapeptide-transferase [Candidatus Nanopelagicales bacterium]|mgnify:FL=1|jgi:phospho-N-acetylmuramoyl-pentapeptide-transferase|nr:phospho-N-acetylmuramoyl-pentapeptide-transferase [Actinomycetota bacterium]NCG02185.1 phospho-N-acetylmuramoyl-pentapeptide-transferase [Actinomycetales bacterium]MBT5182573.1 phospho-N-acetylmuramoyl-pentapeptide-transferase [Actinomycetota bacterium]MBT5500574.1 phospho-N-acetylmuramoyl-pentapeptide-transferase [Actinomycetota bacterium]MBT5806515.1 phospho-N-acetylmuramoyl-pentapeptide-transferase [Actinomycetota bacterium]